MPSEKAFEIKLNARLIRIGAPAEFSRRKRIRFNRLAKRWMGRGTIESTEFRLDPETGLEMLVISGKKPSQNMRHLVPYQHVDLVYGCAGDTTQIRSILQ